MWPTKHKFKTLIQYLHTSISMYPLSLFSMWGDSHWSLDKVGSVRSAVRIDSSIKFCKNNLTSNWQLKEHKEDKEYKFLHLFIDGLKIIQLIINPTFSLLLPQYNVLQLRSVHFAAKLTHYLKNVDCKHSKFLNRIQQSWKQFLLPSVWQTSDLKHLQTVRVRLYSFDSSFKVHLL